jgi:hypothetical protein
VTIIRCFVDDFLCMCATQLVMAGGYKKHPEGWIAARSALCKTFGTF